MCRVIRLSNIQLLYTSRMLGCPRLWRITKSSLHHEGIYNINEWTWCQYFLNRKKLGTFLKNKVLQKREFSKCVNNEKCSPKTIFLNEKKIKKIQIISELKNWLWRSKFCKLPRTRNSFYQKNIGVEFTHSYISSFCYEFIVICHNLGHPNVCIRQAITTHKCTNLIFL